MNLRAGESLRVVVWESDGVSCVPVFTSKAELARSPRPVGEYLRIGFSALAEVVRDGPPIVLNPGLETALTLAPGALRAPHRVVGGSHIAIGEPAQEPGPLLEMVAAFCEEAPQVLRAWRALVKLDDAPPQPLIGLELAHGTDRDGVLGSLVGRAELQALTPALMVAVDRDEPDTFADYLLGSGQPFWERSTSGRGTGETEADGSR